jgi:hypothetical protein
MGLGQLYQPVHNNGTAGVNSQLLPFPMHNSFFPQLAQGPMFSGNGQPPPTIPINYMGMNANYTGGGVSDPWSPTMSPLPITIGALIVGFLLLRFVHWR